MNFDFSHIELSSTPASTEQAPVVEHGSTMSELVCLERKAETPDTATFVFNAVHLTAQDYFPGQFILIEVEIDGQAHQRAYSLSSSPVNTDTLAITVKRVEQGLVSNYLMDNLTPGMTVKAGQPSGEFYLEDDSNRPHHIFVSAGSGITPVMSMTRTLLARDASAHIHFIHCCRTTADVIFAEELMRLDQAHEHFKLDLMLSREQDTGHHFGRLNKELFEQLTPELATHVVYTCGPNEFMAMLSDSLNSRGFAMAHFHQESFGLGTLEPNKSLVPGEEVSIEIPAFGQTISAPINGNLLSALEEGGLPIVAACRSGVCGSCKCKVTKGQVKSTSQATLSGEDIAAGYVLACSSTIDETLSVEIN